MCRQEKICKETGEEELKVPHLQHPVDESATHPISPLLQQITPAFQQQLISPVLQQQPQIATVFQQQPQQQIVSSARQFTHPFTSIASGPTGTGRSARVGSLLAGRILFDIPSSRQTETVGGTSITFGSTLPCPDHTTLFLRVDLSEVSLEAISRILNNEGYYRVFPDITFRSSGPANYAYAYAATGSHVRARMLQEAAAYILNAETDFPHIRREGRRNLPQLLEEPMVYVNGRVYGGWRINKITKHQKQQHQKPRNHLCCWRNMH